jgi:SOS-response transcriptional repressor LexA
METTTAAATTDVVPLRSSVAAGVGHKPSRDVKVTARTCQQKGCTAILITTRRQHAARSLTAQQRNKASHRRRQLQRQLTISSLPLRSRVAAGVRHKPSRDIEVTTLTCQQKGCTTVLARIRRQPAMPSLTAQQGSTKTTTAATTTHGVPLRSRVAAGVRCKPPRNIEVTVLACQQRSSRRGARRHGDGRGARRRWRRGAEAATWTRTAACREG